jgi:hypothetical protein
MRQSNLSAKSCNDYIAGMDSFFKWLYENEHIPEPLKISRMKEEKKVFRSFSVIPQLREEGHLILAQVVM